MKYLLINGKVIFPNHIDSTINVIVDKGIIKGFTKQATLEDAEIIDAKGQYISPGFIDIHTHGGNGSDYQDGTLEAFVNASTMHMKHGVTSIVPTTVASDFNSTIDFFKSYEQHYNNPKVLTRMLGIHLEGPYLSYNQKGAIPGQYLKDPIYEEYIQWFNASKHISRWTIAPELPGAMEFAQEGVRRGIQISIGHSDAFDSHVYEAITNGFSSVTHLYSMTSGVVRINCYRHSGIIESALLRDDLYTEAISDGHHLPDTLLSLIYKCKGVDKMILVTDSMSAAGLGEGEFTLGNPKDNHRVLVKGGVAFMPDMSSFAGSVATADQLIRTMQKLNIPLYNIVKMMSLTPAKLMKLDKEIGSIEIGKKADIILYDENINVSLVFVDGKIKHSL